MTFKPDLTTLPADQQKIWTSLSPAKELGFCLYGGTALVLRFGHRETVDFDFFSSQALDKELLIAWSPRITSTSPRCWRGATNSATVSMTPLRCFLD